MSNPFHEGAAAGAYFVGRGEELALITRRLDGLRQKATGHLYVAGLYGTGKTTLLERIVTESRRLNLAATRVEVDSTLRSKPLDQLRQFFQNVLDNLAEDFDDSFGLDTQFRAGPTSSPFLLVKASHLNGTDLGRDIRRVARKVTDLGRYGLVVCIDEAQELNKDGFRALKVGLWDSTDVLAAISIRLTSERPDRLTAARAKLEDLAEDNSVARLFNTTVPLGPFSTDAEATRCIERRLEDTTVRFDSAVIRDIVTISDRVPHRMIDLAHEVYDQACLVNRRTAGQADLMRAVKGRYPEAWDSVNEILDLAGEDEKDALAGLAHCAGPAKIDSIVDQRHSGATAAFRQQLSRSWSDHLCRLTAQVQWCERDDSGTFRLTPIIRRAVAADR